MIGSWGACLIPKWLCSKIRTDPASQPIDANYDADPITVYCLQTVFNQRSNDVITTIRNAARLFYRGALSHQWTLNILHEPTSAQKLAVATDSASNCMPRTQPLDLARILLGSCQEHTQTYLYQNDGVLCGTCTYARTCACACEANSRGTSSYHGLLSA